MNRMFLIEKGKYVIIRDGDKKVSFNNFAEFNKCYPNLNLSKKIYLDYEPDRGIYIDSTDKSISIKDAPVAKYEAVINSINQLIADKADPFFNNTIDQINEIKERQLINALDQHINKVAQSKNYDSRITCALRAGYLNPWRPPLHRR